MKKLDIPQTGDLHLEIYVRSSWHMVDTVSPRMCMPLYTDRGVCTVTLSSISKNLLPNA